MRNSIVEFRDRIRNQMGRSGHVQRALRSSVAWPRHRVMCRVFFRSVVPTSLHGQLSPGVSWKRRRRRRRSVTPDDPSYGCLFAGDAATFECSHFPAGHLFVAWMREPRCFYGDARCCCHFFFFLLFVWHRRTGWARCSPILIYCFAIVDAVRRVIQLALRWVTLVFEVQRFFEFFSRVGIFPFVYRNLLEMVENWQQI